MTCKAPIAMLEIGNETERMAMDLKLIPYHPGEAATATGRNIENQRNDRRNGYTPQHKGHARYDLHGLCRLFVIEQFAQKGIGPMQSVAFADEAAEKIAPHVLLTREPWGEAAWTAAASPEEEFHLKRDMPAWGDKLCDQLRFQKLTEEVMPGASNSKATEGIIVWADGSHEIGTGIWDRFAKQGLNDTEIMGVVTVMMLKPSGRLLASRLSRPLYELT